MSVRKVKMATAILILLNADKRGHSNDMLKKPQNLHSQKLRTVVGQKYHPGWFFWPRPIRTIIKQSALPKGIITKLLGDTKLVRTLAGRLKMQEVLTMRNLRLPKFYKNRRFNQQKVLVFDNDNIKYNIILGTNFLSKTGIKLNYSEGNMEWFDCSIPLHPPGGFDSKEFDAMEDMSHIQVEDKIFGKDWLECFATEILDAKYEKTDVAEVMKGLTHLSAHQKADLL